MRGAIWAGGGVGGDAVARLYGLLAAAGEGFVPLNPASGSGSRLAAPPRATLSGTKLPPTLVAAPTAAEAEALVAGRGDGWEEADVVVRTSGSTDGTGHLVALSLGALRASAEASLDRIGGPGQWVTSLPIHGIAGLQVVLRSVVAGMRPVVYAPAAGFDEALFAAAVARLRAGERHYLSLVPTQLHRILAAAPHLLAGFDAVLVGGAALPPGLAARTERAGVRVVTTYGMTETCGGCVYDGVPLAGVRVRIVDGRIHVAGPVLAQGYLDTDARPFVEEGDERWLVTGDRGEWDGARLRVLGRADAVIVSGGVNVDPHRVEAALAELGGDWVVVGVPDEEWGQRVVAVTTGGPDTAAVPSAVASAVAHLAPAERPKRVVRLEAWPMTPTGKVDRRVVAARAAGA